LGSRRLGCWFHWQRSIRTRACWVWAWAGVTAIAMFALVAGKAKTGAALNNPVLQTEGKVTLVDGILATAVLADLVLNAAFGWWWADPAAGYVVVYYGAREAHHALTS
jgi:divalent metal cation (Fe/Co/Zn/Cd) transporter